MGTFEGKIYINKTVFDSGVRFSNCLPCKLPTSATNLEDVIILATFESCLAVLHPDDLEDTTAEITQMLQQKVGTMKKQRTFENIYDIPLQ